jgi:hypothetical protein
MAALPPWIAGIAVIARYRRDRKCAVGAAAEAGVIIDLYGPAKARAPDTNLIIARTRMSPALGFLQSG